MKRSIDGKALVYAEGAFKTPNGKTAHGLVRYTERYEIVGVIDQHFSGQDAGEVLDKKHSGIPIFSNITSAYQQLGEKNRPKTLVIGLAPDGGRLPHGHKQAIIEAIQLSMNVDSGLHEFLSNDKKISEQAKHNRCQIRDIRKTPPREDLHFFTGKIEQVSCLKIAVLGTDSAVGKRTTAWLIVHGMRVAQHKSELIGTGQTAWLQGAKYSLILDSCINDFVSGEIEHAAHQAWINESPDVLVIEGQGSLLNPAYPGGFEILAAFRPDVIVLQHAPIRKEYDGFPGYPLHDIQTQIKAIELISGKKVIAITINHEGIPYDDIVPSCQRLTELTGLPAFDVLTQGVNELVDLLIKYKQTMT